MANLRDGSYHKDGIHKKAPFLADLLICMDWVELESLDSQQRTAMHIKMSHFRTSIIMRLSYMDWVHGA